MPGDAPLEGLGADMTENGCGYVQWNVRACTQPDLLQPLTPRLLWQIPLYDDDVLWVLPGSHVRRTSDAENAQLAAEPKLSTPLPGSIPVKLKAGDGVTRPLARVSLGCVPHTWRSVQVAYTNFLMHWGSNYSTKLRRTLHAGYQSFDSGVQFRYFHLWWSLPWARARLPAELQPPFARWAAAIAREHDIIDGAFRALLRRDGGSFCAALDRLHRGKEQQLVTAIHLLWIAKDLFEMSQEEAKRSAGGPEEEGASSPPVDERNRFLWEDLRRRYEPEELAALWARFGGLDEQLRYRSEAEAAADTSVSRAQPDGRHAEGEYSVNGMPTGYGLADFVRGLTAHKL